MPTDPKRSGPYQTGWTPRQICLAIVSAIFSLIISGGALVAAALIMERMESPGDRWPNWVVNFAVIIFLGIFVGLWKLAFVFLTERYDTDAS